MGAEVSLDAVCRIPSAFYGGRKSFVAVVRDTGVHPQRAALNAEALTPILRSDPSLIEGWLRWSMNKRVSSGWYFVAESGGYIVGYFPGGECLRFSEAAPACAEFIVREVGETLRSNFRWSGP
jgi:hypothetical protein